MDRDRFSLRKALSALMGATVLLLGIPALTVSAAGIDDYPYRGTPNLLDRWGFYTGYCTSFAAFRLSQEGVVLHGATLQGPNGKSAFFGNGGTWDADAAPIGCRLDGLPTVGYVGAWHGGVDGGLGGGHGVGERGMKSEGDPTGV